MVVVGALISGAGTNLQAIVDEIAAGHLECRIATVISNRPDAHGLTRAGAAGLDTEIVDHRTFATREDFDRRLVEILRTAGVELVVLAGFDRLVTRVLLDAFPHRVMNIHPALLPAFPGLDAQAQAVTHGVKIVGVTVHLVDEETDHGPIVAQGAITIRGDESEATVRQRLLAVEHQLYPLAIRLFAEGRLEVRGRRVLVRGDPPSPSRPILSW